MGTDRVRRDFDRIAQLGDQYDSGSDRYDRAILSWVPPGAVRILDVGCGAGRITNKLASAGRYIVAVDLSPSMISRARAATDHGGRVRFVCGDFLQVDIGEAGFDCVLSAATLHHMPAESALARMQTLIRPGGRIIVHDVRRGNGIVDAIAMTAILGYEATLRLLKTGSPLSPKRVREAWRDHSAGDVYLTTLEARALFDRCLPGTLLRSHRGLRYTAVWDRQR